MEWRTVLNPGVNGISSRLRRWDPSSRTCLGCTTRRVTYGSGSRTAGTRATKAHPIMRGCGAKKREATVLDACFGAVRGYANRISCGHRSGGAAPTCADTALVFVLPGTLNNPFPLVFFATAKTHDLKVSYRCLTTGLSPTLANLARLSRSVGRHRHHIGVLSGHLHSW